MTDTKGKVVGVNGNMVSVEFDGVVSMNEVAYNKVDGKNVKMKGSKAYVADCLKIWLSNYKDPIQLVSDVCHYDMVLLTDIFGTAWDIPSCLNPSCHDINQDIADYYKIDEMQAFDKGREDIIAEHKKIIKGSKHNALYDAKVIKEIYNIIRS